MRIEELNDAILAVCPVDGVNSDGVIWFRPDATEEQRATAQKIMEEKLSILDKEQPDA